MRNPFRKPPVTATVICGKPRTASDALAMMGLFSDLCINHHVSVVQADGDRITVRGKARNVAHFVDRHARLSALGLV